MSEFQKGMSRQELVAVLATINSCIELIVWSPSSLEACRVISEMRDDTLKRIEALDTDSKPESCSPCVGAYQWHPDT